MLQSTLVKPAGPDCNLACSYCFYRPKAALYPRTRTHRMTREVMEEFVRQYMGMTETPSFGWQGGEPTLMGLDFYRQVVRAQQRFGHTGHVVGNSLQTNGILLDREWAAFLAQYNFLVGLSLDGPHSMHDPWRTTPGGSPTLSRVLAAFSVLREHGVETNAMVMVQPSNVGRPDELYDWLLEQGLNFLQFIPLVERDPETRGVADFSIDPEAYGEFLCALFDRWATDGPEKVYIREFNDFLMVHMGAQQPSCIFQPTCGRYVVVEHNGDVYACDFHVDPEWKIGNLTQTPLAELATSRLLREFALRKGRHAAKCRSCEWLSLCHGGCPKHRTITTEDVSQPSYFCEGYRMFFRHTVPRLKQMADDLRPLAQIAPTPEPEASFGPVGRNDPCPCGSGKKYKRCCGR